MAIKQVINYNSESEYFAGFLQAIAEQSDIDARIEKEKKHINLFLDDTDIEALERFSQNSQKYLPHSIFIGEIDTSRVDEGFEKSSLRTKSYNISLCPKCLMDLKNSSTCTHYSNEQSEALLDDQNEYRENYKHGDTLLLTDPSKIDELFLMTEDEIKTLLSIEKPTLKVSIKDETLKSLSAKSFINIKSPSTLKSILISSEAKDKGVKYLFFKETPGLKVSVTQKDILVVKDSIGVSTPLELLDEESVVNRFLNITKEAGISRAIAVNMSSQKGIDFLVSDKKETKRVLKLGAFSLSDTLNTMHLDEKKSRLLNNLEKKYPHILKELESHPQYDVFASICAVLELDARDFETLSDKSMEFHGNGGLKIDTFFKEEGFDYVSFLGSIISFKLAGSDAHFLAYSIFEALADMAISTLTQLKQRYNISNFIMMGDMFENSVLHSRILSKLSLANPYFPKGIALDD
jgi:hypothetical protein